MGVRIGNLTTTSLTIASGAIMWVASLGCAETSRSDSWKFDEPPPESNIDRSYCTSLSHADLEEPEVSKRGDSHWNIRYPAFRHECGAYQLEAVVNFAGEEGEKNYTQTFTVCNRCESAQTWSYLTEFGSVLSTEEPPESHPVPKSPDITEVSGISKKGRPIVGHQTSADEQLVYEILCEGGGNYGHFTNWISYESIRQFSLEPGKAVSTSINVDLDKAAPDLLEIVSASDGTSETTILWPHLFREDVPITGLQAASVPEFCIERIRNRPRGWVRPYQEPYEVDSKYTKQITPAPNLPSDLVDRLRQTADDDAR